MAYTPLNLQNGQVLDAAALAHMEDGIGAGVQFSEQTLTQEQQTQARKNLGLYCSYIDKVFFVNAKSVTFSHVQEGDISAWMTVLENESPASKPEKLFIEVGNEVSTLPMVEIGIYGNASVLDPGAPNTGEKYAVLLYGDGIEIASREEQNANVVISLYGDAEVHEKIPFENMPDEVVSYADEIENAGLPYGTVYVSVGTTTVEEFSSKIEKYRNKKPVLFQVDGSDSGYIQAKTKRLLTNPVVVNNTESETTMYDVMGLDLLHVGSNVRYAPLIRLMFHLSGGIVNRAYIVYENAIYLRSNAGKNYAITVDDSGNLVATETD